MPGNTNEVNAQRPMVTLRLKGATEILKQVRGEGGGNNHLGWSQQMI